MNDTHDTNTKPVTYPEDWLNRYQSDPLSPSVTIKSLTHTRIHFIFGNLDERQ